MEPFARAVREGASLIGSVIRLLAASGGFIDGTSLSVARRPALFC